MSSTAKIKKIIKKIKNNKILSHVVYNFIYWYLRILFLTYRLNVKSENDFKKNFNQNEGVFYFWHQNIIAATFFFFKMKGVGHCIVSPSKDGKLMGFIAQKFGFKVVHGSAYKQSVQLIRQTLDILDANKRLAIVGDGSRGPAFQLQRGTIYLSAKSKVPLVFMEIKTEWAFTFNKSWDKFQVPLPFSKIFVKVHAPVIPSPDAYKQTLIRTL